MRQLLQARVVGCCLDCCGDSLRSVILRCCCFYLSMGYGSLQGTEHRSQVSGHRSQGPCLPPLFFLPASLRGHTGTGASFIILCLCAEILARSYILAMALEPLGY